MARSRLAVWAVAAVMFAMLAPAQAQTTKTSLPARSHSQWNDYAGASDSAQYSALDQINRLTVGKLRVAWSYPTGDGNKYLFNPIVVDRTMYVLAHNHSIVALDATSGKQLWIHPTDLKTSLITNRGINYWESADRSDRRLIFAADNFLQEIDARTGQSISDFGEGGRVDLREGLGRDANSLSLVQSATPGRVFEDLLIMGSATNEEYESGPGDIRAYDVRSGRMVWIFHTVPHPGEAGYETWPKDAWKVVGGANAWSGLSVDVKRGIVFIPTASPKYNFYGADRKGANLFGDCLLALNARTGKLIWYFQMVHHDIWDYDNGTAPMLLTIRHNGKMVDAVAQAGKEGFVWVFNRETGEPLWPIEERAVPRSEMPGEETWPTQPFPLNPPPFARQTFTVKDLSPFMEPEEREKFRKQIEGARNQGLFTPPGVTDTVEMPGNNGGCEFSGSRRRSGAWHLIRGFKGPSLHAEAGTECSRADCGGEFRGGKRACRLSIHLPSLSRGRPNWAAARSAFSCGHWISTPSRSDPCSGDARTGPYAGGCEAIGRGPRFSPGVSCPPGARVGASRRQCFLSTGRNRFDPSARTVALSQQLRFHVHQQWTACDRPAVDHAHRLRPESGNHQMASAARRSPGVSRKRD